MWVVRRTPTTFPMSTWTVAADVVGGAAWCNVDVLGSRWYTLSPQGPGGGVIPPGGPGGCGTPPGRLGGGGGGMASACLRLPLSLVVSCKNVENLICFDIF